jgi:hypothetical protein
MTSLVLFATIDKDWIHRRGQFEVIFGALYELYLDKSRVPTICADLFPIIRGYLHDCWPDKYEEPNGLALDFLRFSDYPTAEQREVMRAAERLLQDFVHDRIDPDLQWGQDRKPYFISVLRELIDLMRAEIAASGPLRLVGGGSRREL